mgnify:CR=1 FL=1
MEGWGVFFVEDLGDGGDGAVGEAAGDEEVVVIHVWVEVEGEAVEGDPFADSYADGADFGGLVGCEGVGWVVFGGDPDTGGGRVSVSDDVVGCEGVDDGLFEQADVVVDAEFGGVEVDDWVADELSWAVVGDISAAIGLVELDALFGEL